MVESLSDIAVALTKAGKGILAADESTATIGKRFETIKTISTQESRRDYRAMLLQTTEAMRKYISGVILYDETFFQKTSAGQAFVDLIKGDGALAGIKVDIGAKSLAGFAGETITEGLDGLRERLQNYYENGARFAKWRAVIAIDAAGYPTRSSVEQNAHALARYAALCQEAGIVPIVEPEVLMDGRDGMHSIERCYEVTLNVLRIVFEKLYEARIVLEGMVLKPNMVIDGKKLRKASVEEVAERTLSCLKASVPAAVPGIAFLSGGQSDIEATAHLNAINAMRGHSPWQLTFSYGRALQSEALKIWAGKAENVAKAQEAFLHRAKMNSLAAQGQWSQELENL